MATSDWHQVASGAVAFPSIVSSSGLFDGELSGDELIDIGIEGINTVSDEADEKTDDIDHCIRVAMTAAAIDNNDFGAFRPSSSFSNLSSLLDTSTGPATEAVAEMAHAISPPREDPIAMALNLLKHAEEPAKNIITPRKRIAAASTEEKPPSKKRNGCAGRVSGAGTPHHGSTKITMHDQEALLLFPSIYMAPSTPAAPRVSIIGATAPPKPETSTTSTEPAKQVDMDTIETAAATFTARPASPSSSSESVATIKADFQSLAQGAISDLVAGTASEELFGGESKDGDEQVDTSTSHVMALTGANWFATLPAGSVTAAESRAKNHARRQNLTPDERIRQKRNRNREHARNARLRKKAYVEELQRTLVEFVAQRDAAELEKQQKAQREMEQRDVRFRVIEEFLKLRGRNDDVSARWAALLEESFSVTVPKTSFHSVGNSLMDGSSEQVLNGVSETMADSSNFSAFLQSLTEDGNETVIFVYHCDRKKFLMDGCTAVLNWSATSVGATKIPELQLKGSIQATFNPKSNKMTSATISFDPRVLFNCVQQLMDATDTHSDLSATGAAAVTNEAEASLDFLQMNNVPSSSSKGGSCGISVTSHDKFSSSLDDEDAKTCPE